MNAFAGIGMGAIQTGLFLPRARDAGLESTLLVRDRRLAEGVERAGRIVVNVAGADGIVQEEVPGIGIRVLGDPDCCDDLVAAGEITIAVSTVSDYAGLAGLLAAAMGRKAAGEGPPCLLYACQNEAGAADSLTQAIMNAGGVGRMFQAVDMVIGKMSRTIRDAGECARLGLVPAFPGAGHAWLVEAYDTIHMSQVDRRKGVERRLQNLEECDDLHPFGIAKLNGHNAAHAALAYAGRMMGVDQIADVLDCRGVAELVRGAFLHETGMALQRCYGHVDPLFSEPGWAEHCDDLFSRMANPWLNDDCGRVGRDSERKLGWSDRFIGTIRWVEAAGVAADRWRLATQCAIEACGFDDVRLARLWKAEGADDREIALMLDGQRMMASAYSRWRSGIPMA